MIITSCYSPKELSILQVEHVMREQNVLAANEFIELFCELVVARLSIIAKQRYKLGKLSSLVKCKTNILENLMIKSKLFQGMPSRSKGRDC